MTRRRRDSGYDDAAVGFKGTERFETRQVIGEGAMGVVYEAYDHERGEVSALKTLRWVDAQTLLRFKTEFRALQDIEHPNLVSLRELFEVDGDWFFTMELIDGCGFLDYVRDDEHRLRATLSQLGHGLGALHAAGKIHRDVKPSNVMVDRAGRAVLLDFGLILDPQRRASTEALIVGTVAYMAPEQANSNMVTPACDWYALGVLLYEALTGRLPFEGQALEVLMNKQRFAAPPPHELVQGVSEDLNALCMDLLNKDPAKRPTPAEVLRRLAADDSPVGITATSPLPFVGRGAELAALRGAYSDSRKSAVTVLVHGESGMGKSELVRQFAAELAMMQPPVVVLEGRCYERESVPYKAFDGVIDALSQHLSAIGASEVEPLIPPLASSLSELFPVLSRVEGIAMAPQWSRDVRDPLERRASSFAALRELFMRVAVREPVVMIIDDLQWTDADSITLLADLLHLPDPPPVLLIATVRVPIRGTDPRAAIVNSDSLPGTVRCLEVGPLDRNDARSLVVALSPRLARDHSDVVDAIIDEVQGHPLFAQALVRHCDAGHRDVSTRLDDLLWSRVSTLEPAAARLLKVVCVAGAPISQQVAGYAADRTKGALSRDISTLRSSMLVRTQGALPTDMIEPYHDRVAEAILARLDDATRRGLHERLAISLERDGATSTSPYTLVRHLVAAGRLEHAAQNAQRGAELAVAAFAFDRAAELFETALRIGADGYDKDEVRRLRLCLGDALGNAGRGTESAAAFLDAADGADAVTRLDSRRRAAEQLLIAGHIERGLEIIGAVLGEIGARLPTSPRRALASLLWHRFRLRLRGRRWQERSEQQIAPDELMRLDVYQAVAHGLGTVDTIRGMDFHLRGLLLAFKLGEPRRVGAGLAYEAILHASEGGRALRHGRVLVGEARAISERTRAPYLTAWVHLADGMLAFFDSRFHDGADHLLSAEETFRDHTAGSMWELNNVRVFRLQLLRFMGLFSQVRVLLPVYLRAAVLRGDRYIETSMRRDHSFLHLVNGQPDQARRELDTARWTPPEGGYHLQHWYELRARGELALYEKRATAGLAELSDSFDRLAASLLLRVQFVRALSRWVRGRLCLAAVEEGGDIRLTREAQAIAKSLIREGTGYGKTWGQLLKAGVAMQTRGAESAAISLRLALSLATDNHLHMCVAAAQVHLGALLGGDEGAAFVASAAAYAQREELAVPDRLMATVCPGFGELTVVAS